MLWRWNKQHLRANPEQGCQLKILTFLRLFFISHYLFLSLSLFLSSSLFLSLSFILIKTKSIKIVFSSQNITASDLCFVLLLYSHLSFCFSFFWCLLYYSVCFWVVVERKYGILEKQWNVNTLREKKHLCMFFNHYSLSRRLRTCIYSHT